MSRRDKVKHAILREVSNILHNELKDPRLGFITVTDVDLSPDMRNAKIFYSVLGKEKDYEKTKEALESGLGYIRKLVAERIQLRFAPELCFREDHSAEYGIHMQQVFEELKNLDGPEKKGADEAEG
jgi:ribosome-binding factor A